MAALAANNVADPRPSRPGRSFESDEERVIALKAKIEATIAFRAADLEAEQASEAATKAEEASKIAQIQAQTLAIRGAHDSAYGAQQLANEARLAFEGAKDAERLVHEAEVAVRDAAKRVTEAKITSHWLASEAERAESEWYSAYEDAADDAAEASDAATEAHKVFERIEAVLHAEEVAFLAEAVALAELDKQQVEADGAV